jgi:transposase
MPIIWVNYTPTDLSEKKKAGKNTGLCRDMTLAVNHLRAASSTFSPAFCTSLPAPATVLHPANRAKETIDNNIRASERFMLLPLDWISGD